MDFRRHNYSLKSFNIKSNLYDRREHLSLYILYVLLNYFWEGITFKLFFDVFIGLYHRFKSICLKKMVDIKIEFLKNGVRFRNEGIILTKVQNHRSPR